MFIIYLLVAIAITILGTLALQRNCDSNDAVLTSARVGFGWPILAGLWLYRFLVKRRRK